MKPCDLPANANTPPYVAALWAGLPYTMWTLSLEMAVQNWRFMAAAQQAAVNALTAAGATEESPVAACAAADVREAGAAVLRAQLDAIDTIRRAV